MRLQSSFVYKELSLGLVLVLGDWDCVVDDDDGSVFICFQTKKLFTKEQLYSLPLSHSLSEWATRATIESNNEIS